MTIGGRITGYRPLLKQRQTPRPGQGPIDVTFVEVVPVPIDRTDQLPGRVVSFWVAEIRSQVGGIIESRLFEEGSYVEERRLIRLRREALVSRVALFAASSLSLHVHTDVTNSGPDPA